MALLERVTALVKANINDLVSKAENPEKLLRQLLLDMENQFIQVKTQLAIAIAGQHLLEMKQNEHLASQQDCLRKADLAVRKYDEALARVALDRSLTYEAAAQNFAQQIEDQAQQVTMLKDALHRLDQKLTETRANSEVLIAQYRRARLAKRASASTFQESGQDTQFRRMKDKISAAGTEGIGLLAASGEETIERRLQKLEREERVEKLLEELKQRT